MNFTKILAVFLNGMRISMEISLQIVSAGILKANGV